MISPEARGRMLILSGAVLFGTTGTAQEFAPSGIDPASTGAIRMMVGGPLLGLMALLLRGHSIRGPWPAGSLLLGIVGVAAFQYCFFKSVHMTGVAVGTMVAIGCSPIVAGALGFIFLKEPLGRRWFLSATLTLTGCCLLVLPNSDVAVDGGGILLAVGAGSGYAIYILAAKRLMKTITALSMVAVVLSAAGVLLLPVLLDARWDLWLTARGIGAGLWLGVAGTAAAYLLMAMGLATTPVSSAALLVLAEPLAACLLGIIVLGEPLTTIPVLGMAMIFGGLVFVSR